MKDKVLEKCRVMNEKMKAAIMAFQFNDKLMQRLGRVSGSLSELSSLVSGSGRLSSPSQWHNLQKNIKSKFTIAEDKHVFDDILKGKSIEEILNSLSSGSQ